VSPDTVSIYRVADAAMNESTGKSEGFNRFDSDKLI